MLLSTEKALQKRTLYTEKHNEKECPERCNSQNVQKNAAKYVQKNSYKA